MSKVTRCREVARPAKAAPITALTKILFALGAVLFFGLAHIHLRVCLSATRREISAAQTEQGQLQSQINALRGENESMKNPKALQAYARNELGMVSYNPSTRDSIVIPREVETRYALARAAAGATMLASAREEPRWIQSLGERIGMVGDAMAQDSPR